MTPEQWQKVRPILESALELHPSSRLNFLNRACPDASLRREVESLLASHEQAGTDVLKPGLPVELRLDEEAQFRLLPGKRVGPYEILEEIAQGGMGAVYRAIRADGQYKQQVALKIVRADLGVELTATRFRNERQILASLDHPNIAKILDGGTTADGLPYFVMELIDGLAITDYCDQHKLSIDTRLKIFRTVCSAVHYAHQHLVIHRDLKPSNILIAGNGVPKLLDFGVAKILDPSLLPENMTLTVGGLRMMTPEYASPEQLRGEAITTATDIYSLGLVLYELLSGHRAYRFPNRMPHEIARVVLESDPEKPSTAMRRAENAAEAGQEKTALTPELISTRRADSPEKLRRILSGDLDNIVIKAIHKDPRERYSSADQLSEDIRRHLEALPVLARKSTVAYRCRKYVLRHKVSVTAAALVLLSLLTGIALTLREARIARANEMRAEKRFNDVRTLANSLVFEVHDSIKDLAGATAARKLIVQRAQEYLDRLATDSKSDPSLMRELSAAYARLASVLGNTNDANIGNSEQALRNYRRVVELREAVVAAWPSNPDARRELAQAYMELGPALQESRGETQNLIDKALAILDPLAVSHPDDLKIQYALGKAFERKAGTLAAKGNWEEARVKYGESLAIYQRLAQADPKDRQYLIEVAFAHKHLGAMLINENQLQPALEEYRAALTIDEAQIQADPQNANRRYFITYTYSDIGFILGQQRDIDGALSYYRKAFDIRRAQAAADPQDTRARAGLAATHNYIARLLWQKGDLPGALEDEKQALSIRQALSQTDPANESKRLYVAFSEGSVGETYVKMAFQPHATSQRQLALCEKAEFWLKRASSELQQLKGVLPAGEREYPAMVRQAMDRCNAVVQSQGNQNPTSRP